MRPGRGRVRRGRQSAPLASRAFVIFFRFDKQTFASLSLSRCIFFLLVLHCLERPIFITCRENRKGRTEVTENTNCLEIKENTKRPKRKYKQNQLRRHGAVSVSSSFGVVFGRSALCCGTSPFFLSAFGNFPRAGRLRARPRNFMRRIYHTRNSERARR